MWINLLIDDPDNSPSLLFLLIIINRVSIYNNLELRTIRN